MNPNWLEKIRIIIMLSPKKRVLLIFIILWSLSFIFQVANFLISYSYNPPSSCIETKNTILQEITTAGYCESDSDCIILKVSCPFNCTSIHKIHNDILTKKAVAYNNECGMCVNECNTSNASPTCIDHQCSLQ